ncbi:hypothetical protein BD289DRAFT_244478 [Coniella lustricola]|uniref:Uncharacterized protein n=1 Tax=Coniella lustricola TaxID=2025994 RepID=A0A2T3A9A0_9PEZI|nr:hypothetical protein BD289DRAFT_244478 [Coniella lustricola]
MVLWSLLFPYCLDKFSTRRLLPLGFLASPIEATNLECWFYGTAFLDRGRVGFFFFFLLVSFYSSSWKLLFLLYTHFFVFSGLLALYYFLFWSVLFISFICWFWFLLFWLALRTNCITTILHEFALGFRGPGKSLCVLMTTTRLMIFRFDFSLIHFMLS